MLVVVIFCDIGDGHVLAYTLSLVEFHRLHNVYEVLGCENQWQLRVRLYI